VLTSRATRRRVTFRIAVTSRRVMDGTMSASTAVAPSGPTMSPELEIPVSPWGSMPDAWM
jgi:hypothetical protein